MLAVCEMAGILFLKFMNMKQRAPRNRTLVVAPEEVAELDKRIVDGSGLAVGDDVADATICGDVTRVLSMLPDGFADLVIADPPYNLNKRFGTMNFSAMSEERYEAYLESWIPAVVAKLKADGTMYVCGDWRCGSAIQRVLSRHMTVINRITWQREKGRGATANWKNSMEDIWYAVKNPDDYFFDLEAVKMRRLVRAPYRENGVPKDWNITELGNFRDTSPQNLWDDISVPFWSMPENTDHPTQKPEKLYAKLILASSQPGDVVFDPFLGSGTASVVAKKLGRRYCGVELNREYCRLAAKRLLLAEDDASIQGYEDGVFWERNSRPMAMKPKRKR